MGKRKIPGKKHRGIRDPVKQQEVRLAQIKDKINDPPTSNSKLSYKLTQFEKLKNIAKSGKKIKNIGGIEDKPRKPEKKLNPIKQLPNEDDDDYLRRVNRITHESVKEAEYEAKYGVDVVRDPKTGEISIKKRPKDELMEIMKNKKRRGGGIGGIAKTKQTTKVKIPKELIKEVFKEEKKQEKDQQDKEYKRDVIKFGEVVHGPPVLSTLPRKAQRSDPVPRPGKKNNLLLKGILNNAEKMKTNKGNISTKTKKPENHGSGTNLKGKRKEMTLGTRLMLEEEQKKAIQLYKKLKKNKMKVQE